MKNLLILGIIQRIGRWINMLKPVEVLRPVEVYAILRRRLGNNSPSPITDETLTVNENGEIEINITLGNIYVDMTDGYLKTDIDNVFSVNENGYLISSI